MRKKLPGYGKLQMRHLQRARKARRKLCAADMLMWETMDELYRLRKSLRGKARRRWGRRIARIMEWIGEGKYLLARAELGRVVREMEEALGYREPLWIEMEWKDPEEESEVKEDG